MLSEQSTNNAVKLAPISTSQVSNRIKNTKLSNTQPIYYPPEARNPDPVSASLNSLRLNNRDPESEPSYSDTVYGYYT